MESPEETLEIIGEVEVQGKVPLVKYKGRITKNLEPEIGQEDSTYVFFLGIPYGIPPVGRNRFKPAKPYETKESEYEALKCKPVGRKYGSIKDLSIGSDDCLFLNIYLPKAPIIPKKRFASLLPVLVYFHGGGKGRGDANYRNITPDSMMKEDIILVTVNYRLGVYDMHMKSCETNAGLKDQVLALRWIKNNIRAFGGDPKNVTICGQSAGGSCVNLHLISPLSKGLFHKAIIMSGGIYSPWGFTGNHRELMLDYKEAHDSVKILRDFVANSLRLACLDSLQKTNVNEALEKLAHEDHVSIHLGPTVENSPKGAFLPPCNDLKELMDKAKPIPILAGICKKEGYLIQEEDMSWIKNREKVVRFLMVSLRWSKRSALKQVGAIWKLYFSKMDKMTDNEIKEKFADFCTDLWFCNFYQNFEFKRNKYKEDEPFFVYLFDFVEGINTAYDFTKEPKGAAHGDDLDFLFCPFEKRVAFKPFGEHLQDKIKTMCQLWASFCKSKQPETSLHKIKWRPHKDDDPCYLHIGNDKVEVKSGELFRRQWANLRKIIEAEPTIPPLGTTPLTPGCYEALYADFRQVLKTDDEWLNTAVEVTQGERPKSPEAGVSTGKDDPSQQEPESLTPGSSTNKDDANQQILPSSEPGPSTTLQKSQRSKLERPRVLDRSVKSMEDFFESLELK